MRDEHSGKQVLRVITVGWRLENCTFGKAKTFPSNEIGESLRALRANSPEYSSLKKSNHS